MERRFGNENILIFVLIAFSLIIIRNRPEFGLFFLKPERNVVFGSVDGWRHRRFISMYQNGAP
jgi:hypothetical protein